MARRLSPWKRKVDSRVAYIIIGIAAFSVMAEALILRYAVGRAYAIAFERISQAPVMHFGEEEMSRVYTVYRDSSYGFSLRMPASWEGMAVSRRTVSWPAAGSAPTVDFSLSSRGAAKRLFSVHILTRDQWQAIGSLHDVTYLGERGDTIFAASANADIPKELGERAMEVGGIIESFDVR